MMMILVDIHFILFNIQKFQSTLLNLRNQQSWNNYELKSQFLLKLDHQVSKILLHLLQEETRKMNNPYYSKQTEIRNNNNNGKSQNNNITPNTLVKIYNPEILDYKQQIQEKKKKFDNYYQEEKKQIIRKRQEAQKKLKEKEQNQNKQKEKNRMMMESQLICQNKSLDLFNSNIEQLRLELQNKYTNKKNKVTDEENWELMESYQSYFKKAETREEFRKRYLKLAKDNVKYCNCNCCRNSDTDICECYNWSCECVYNCFRCICCCSWQFLMWATCSIISIPYVICCCYCKKQFANWCWSSFFKKIGTYSDKQSTCSQLCCQNCADCNFGKEGFQFFKSCCRDLPDFCKHFWGNMVCCPVKCAKNCCLCMTTFCGDCFDCCKILCCGRKQVIIKLRKIYEKYENKILH